MSKNYLKLQYSILILNCLVIPFLVTGPFLSDLAVSLSSVLFLIYCALEKKWNYFNNNFFKFFFSFYLYYLFRSVEADDITRVLTKHIFYIRHGIFVISTMWLIKNFYNYKLYFFYIAILTFFIVCADATFQFFYGANILGFESGNNYGRISGLFNDEYVLGSYISRLSPLILGLFYFYFKDKKGLIIFIFSLFYLVVLLSGERTSLVLINLFLVYFFIFVKNHKKQKIYLIILISLVSIFSLNFDRELKGRIFSHTFDQLGINNENFQINFFSETHEDHIAVAYRMFKDNIFFGKGPRLYQKVCLEEKFYTDTNGNNKLCPTHPHHFYFQVLAETGLVGLFFIFIIIYKIFILLITEIKSYFLTKESTFNNYQIILLGSIIINLFPLVPSGNIFNNWMSIIYFIPVGFILDSFKKQNDK
jgi:O-antigen ligase